MLHLPFERKKSERLQRIAHLATFKINFLAYCWAIVIGILTRNPTFIPGLRA